MVESVDSLYAKIKKVASPLGENSKFELECFTALASLWLDAYFALIVFYLFLPLGQPITNLDADTFIKIHGGCE